MRGLDIGPGRSPVKGFDTVDIRPLKGVKYQADARQLPFADNEFDIVHASHIIEHIPWFQTINTLKEWVRVLKPGGRLEVWTVDAYKVAKALVEYEDGGSWQIGDGWARYGADKNPYLWCAGRIFAFPRSDGEDSANWHRALFTPKHLMDCFNQVGLADIRFMDRSEVRSRDHRLINLGVTGVKV